MSYNTLAEIRTELGVDGNLSVTDSELTIILNEAYSLVRSEVGSYYDITELISTASNFTGSDGENILKRLEKTLSKAYFYQRFYGYDSDNGKMGYEIEKETKNTLKEIKEGNSKLFNTNQDEFTRQASSLSGEADGGGFEEDEAIFSMDDEY